MLTHCESLFKKEHVIHEPGVTSTIANNVTQQWLNSVATKVIRVANRRILA
jgi:hypothetical protein